MLKFWSNNKLVVYTDILFQLLMKIIFKAFIFNDINQVINIDNTYM